MNLLYKQNFKESTKNEHFFILKINSSDKAVEN